MKLAFFAVPALVPGEAVAEVNAFLAAHRVVAVDRELVRESSGAWSRAADSLGFRRSELIRRAAPDD